MEQIENQKKKKKVGRPRKVPSELKVELVGFKLATDERKVLDDYCSRNKISTSDALRNFVRSLARS